MKFLIALVEVVTVVLMGILKFLGLWIAYGFAWFMILCVLLLLTRKVPERASKVRRGKVTVDFWVCLWFGFMTAVIHVIIALFLA